MDVSMSPSTTPLSWESCPEELLRMIFKQLSLKSLVSCMTVNRRWKTIVLDYIELYSLWPKIFSETMVNKGRTFQRKSGYELSFKDLLVNSLLWSFVRFANMHHYHTYEMKNIIRVQVNKEYLILTGDPRTWKAHTRFFNIRNTILEIVYGTEIDFKENDYMRVVFDRDKWELQAFGKVNPYFDRGTNHDLMFEMENPFLYKLEDNVCYVVSMYHVVFALIWDRKDWEMDMRGRFYGDHLDEVCDLYVYNDRVCLITQLGIIFCEVPETKSYVKINSNKLAAIIEDATVFKLFRQNGIAISVNRDQRLKVCQDKKTNFMWLECGGMTCATEHGEILFIGYKDGTVAICTPHTMPAGHCRPDRLFNVRDFVRSIQDPTILAVEVFEDQLCHHLFVATRHKVVQIVITYPHHILEAAVTVSDEFRNPGFENRVEHDASLTRAWCCSDSEPSNARRPQARADGGRGSPWVSRRSGRQESTNESRNKRSM